jgi:hypothetical protein
LRLLFRLGAASPEGRIPDQSPGRQRPRRDQDQARRADLAACHTAEVSGYVVEGHVPAVALKRLLAEKPDAAGLAVPGMPVGSPGMEGGAPEKYDVVLFGPSGRRPYMRFLGGSAVD